MRVTLTRIQLVEPRDRAQALIERYDAELRTCFPPGTDLFDAHLHLGHDIDGMVGDYDQLEALMAQVRPVARLHVLPRRGRPPSGLQRRQQPHARVRGAERGPADPVRAPRPERDADRGGAAAASTLGARGIKLHPRAQKFTATDERLGPVFELAAERRVPILIHGGRGLPPIADGLRALVDRYPEARLIIAHAGIADLAELARCMAGRKGVLFDTSTWSPIDLLDFYRQVPPEQVVYASDYPYGQQPSSLLIALKTAQLRRATRTRSCAACSAAPGTRSPTATTCPSRRHRSGSELVHPADAARAHPPVPLDGDAAPLDAAARHDRRPRPRHQHLRRAQRARRRRRPDPRAARGGARSLALDPDRSRTRSSSGS